MENIIDIYFVNIKKYPEVIMGYVIGILALILEIILPAIIFFIYGNISFLDYQLLF